MQGSRYPVLLGVALMAPFAGLAVSDPVPAANGAAAEAVPAPRVLHTGRVAPAILGITIQDGTLVRGGQGPYVADPDDEVRLGRSGYVPANTPQLWRRGEFVGWLVERQRVVSYGDRVVGRLTGTEWLEQPASYTIESVTDARFRQGGRPAAVHRKSLPHGTARDAHGVLPAGASVQHTVYLRLDAPWRNGASYTIRFPADLPPLTVTVSDRLESEAIHVSQVGFRPGDEPKVAYLSCWLGTGGTLAQPAAVAFSVVNSAGQEVYRGDGQITTRAQDNEGPTDHPRNFSLTDVAMLEFSEVTAPGEYRIVVPGIGCSYPVTIAEDVWHKAFLLVMKGLYAQRSGVELGPPYVPFRRPRNLHPADGVKVTQSTLTLIDSSNGLSALGRDQGGFDVLVAGATGEALPPEACWGGLADAGDWDRRIQHLDVSRLQLDLLLENGAPAAGTRLDRPESGNGLPDLLNDAIWNLDFYRRLMTPDGGVRGGIESAEHPKAGEGSWQESWPLYAYAPDPWCGYLFAATAARCAHAAAGMPGQVTETFRTAALKAMAWSETALARWPAEDLARRSPYGGAVTERLRRARNTAAADLYRLTGEPAWHELFAQTLDAHCEDGAWVYLRTDRPRRAELLEACRRQIVGEAERILTEQGKVGFRWTRRWPGAETWQWGLFARPEGGVTLVRAWRLTGEVRFRRAMVLAAQMAVGANPNNLAYCAGLGRNPMRNVFWHDTEVQGLGPPDGLVAFGPIDAMTTYAGYSQLHAIAPFCVPRYQDWPLTEFCVDSGRVHPIDEFTPDSTMGPVAYLWGTLAF